MSIIAANINTSTFTVGKTGNIDLASLGMSYSQDKPATIIILNESGVGFQFDFDKGGSFFLAAGGWVAHPIPYMASNLKYTAIYVMSNPPVNSLLATVYAPGEQIPTTQTLGNSPVSGSTVAGISTLSNETNSAGTEVIDIGVTGAPTQKLIDIFNDHFVWSVLQSGVIHQVLSGNTSGNPLQLGQVNDSTEILGSLIVDALASVNGTKTTTNGGTAGTVDVCTIFIGTNFKVNFVKMSGFQVGGSDQNVSLGTTYTNGCFFISGDTGSWSLKAGGVKQNIETVTTLGIGGSVTTQTNTDKFAFGECRQGSLDTITFNTPYNTTHFGFIVLIGR